ncbi:MAG: hypothetical protein R3C16_06240 [Hyphomonadaceae bacterium]
MSHPFPLPDDMEPDLKAVRDHWQAMIRGDNNMPFWDDYQPSALPNAARAMLLDVFDEPFRARFSNTIGAEVAQKYGEALPGQFIDEVKLKPPVDYLGSQALAAIEARAPTYYRADSYTRLLLPMWGDGRIGMLLCAYSWR